MKKRIFSIALCFVMVALLFAGCGEKEVEKDGKQTIRMTYSPGEIDGESKDLNVIFAEFFKEHPNVEITLEEGGSALMAKIAANDAPDIIRTNAVKDLPTYVNKNIAMPLDELLEKSDKFDESDIFPICIDAFKYDGKEFGKGKIYGLPKDWSPSAFWVNKAMFDEKGLKVPTIEEPVTYDELFDYAKQLTVKEGNKVKVYGYSDINSPGITAEKMLNLIGKSLYSDNFSKINLKDEKVREVFKYIYDMKVNGYNQSALYPMAAGSNGNAEFPQGMCAMNNFGLYSGSVYLKNPDRTVEFEDMILCPSPVMEEGQKTTYTASPVGAIIAATVPDEKIDVVFDCWEFIHLGIPAEKRAKSGFNLPVKKSVAQSVQIENEFQRGNYEFTLDYLNKCDYIFVRTNPYISSAGLEGVFEKYFTPLLYDEYSFDESMNLIEEEIQLLIDEGMAN